MKNGKKVILVTSKSVFTISLIVAFVTILFVFITGLKINRSIIDNSLISLSILSLSFFTFITCGLYFGFKLKDNIGDLTKQITWESSGSGVFPDFDSGGGKGVMEGSIEAGAEHGIEGIIVTILLWVGITIFLVLLIVFFETIVWAMLMIFLGMLYWVFFRALRLVFKNSVKCKGNFSKSVLLALGYTLLYTSWMYGIVLVTTIIKYNLQG